MRKLIVISMISLDGVIQAPGGPEEDPSGGFQYGGWVSPYGDEAYAKVVKEQMQPADLLLGRKTFEIFASYWPEHEAGWPGINDFTKYVLTSTLQQSDPIARWKNSVILNDPDAIQKLKASEGSDIKVWGSGELVQLLLKNDLVDELWLKIHPLTLGKGKKLFDGGAIPAAFSLIESSVTPSGVIMANYRRSGKVKTGTVSV